MGGPPPPRMCGPPQIKRPIAIKKPPGGASSSKPKTKPLFWEVFPPATVNKSYWSDITSFTLSGFNWDDLITVFSAAARKEGPANKV